jgi:hypothetical protein
MMAKPSNADNWLAEDIGGFYADPLAYVLYAFAWPIGEQAGPDDWQRDCLKRMGEGTLTVEAALQMATTSGHGVGKSALVAWIILWAMSTRPHLAGVVTANTKQQLETKTWRELAVWHKRAINRDWFEWTATKFYQVDNPDTWFVAAVPWTKERSEAFAGLHADHVLVIFDEASAIDDKIWEVVEGAMTTKGAMWFVFGNPTRNTGRFRECWGKFRHRWGRKQVDSRTSKIANQAKIQQWIADYGDDSDFVRVRVKGEFPRTGSNQFIDSEMVEEAQRREIGLDPGAALILGVDPARFGDDQSVCYFRRGRDARSMLPHRFRGLDLMDLSDRIAGLIEKFKPDAVCVDGVGIGAGVVDRLKQLGYRVHEVQAGAKASDDKEWYNKRAELWGRMREWLKTGTIPVDGELRDDLTAPEYGFDNRGRTQLERKEDMKDRGLPSPDTGDALAHTFAVTVPRRDVPQRLATEEVADGVASYHWGEA